MPVLAHNDVIVHRDPERRGNVDDSLGHLDIRLRRRRIAGGVVVQQAAESSYCVETKEYIGVIDLYRGGDWERFSMLTNDPHAPSSTSTWSRFDARLVTIFF